MKILLTLLTILLILFMNCSNSSDPNQQIPPNVLIIDVIDSLNIKTTQYTQNLIGGYWEYIGKPDPNGYHAIPFYSFLEDSLGMLHVQVHAYEFVFQEWPFSWWIVVKQDTIFLDRMYEGARGKSRSIIRFEEPEKIIIQGYVPAQDGWPAQIHEEVIHLRQPSLPGSSNDRYPPK